MHYSTTYPHWNPTTIITSSNRSTAYRSFIVIIFTAASNSTTTLTTTTSTSTSVHRFLVSFKAPPSFTGLENEGHFYYYHIKITINYNASPNEQISSCIGGIQALLISIIIPYHGAYFGLFDTLSSYKPWQKDSNPLFRASSKFAFTQVSAIAAGYASYPFDTARHRLQLQSENPKEEWVYAGTMDCFRKIIVKESTAALFNGAGTNTLRTVGAALVHNYFDKGLAWKIVALLAATALPAIIVSTFLVLGIFLASQYPSILSPIIPDQLLLRSIISQQLILHQVILRQPIPRQLNSSQIITSSNPTKELLTASTSSSSNAPHPSVISWVDGPSSLFTPPKYNKHLHASNDRPPRQIYHPVFLLPHATACAASFSAPSSIYDGALAILVQPSSTLWRIIRYILQFSYPRQHHSEPF
jgi:hypothetical protein